MALLFTEMFFGEPKVAILCHYSVKTPFGTFIFRIVVPSTLCGSLFDRLTALVLSSLQCTCYFGRGFRGQAGSITGF